RILPCGLIFQLLRLGPRHDVRQHELVRVSAVGRLARVAPAHVDARGVAARVGPARFAQEEIGVAGELLDLFAAAGVAAVGERAPACGEAHAVGLDRMAYAVQLDLERPDRTMAGADAAE